MSSLFQLRRFTAFDAPGSLPVVHFYLARINKNETSGIYIKRRYGVMWEMVRHTDTMLAQTTPETGWLEIEDIMSLLNAYGLYDMTSQLSQSI